MSLLPRLTSLVRNLIRWERVERELDAEVAAYLDALIAERRAAGRTLTQARREALLQLGGAEQVKEQVRDVRAGAWLEQLRQDVRYGSRQLRRSPGFTLVVTLTLSVGIGASTAVFTLADGLFLRLAHLPLAARLVHVSQTRESRVEAFPLSLADYAYFRDRSQSFTELAAHYSGSPLHLIDDGDPLPVFGGVVTANYFAALGLEPALGRFFGRDEDRVPGRDAVAVIAHSLWDRRFGRNPQVLGRTIQLNGVSFSIIGVAPAGFEADRAGQVTLSVWIPSAMFSTGYRYCNAFDRGCAIVSLTGLLRPGSTSDDARRELSVLARQLEQAYPATNQGRGVRVAEARGVGPERQAESRRSVVLLTAAVAVVLAVACASVAGLLVGRGLGRRREVGVRLAIGASRGRLIKQFLTESVLLGLLGGAGGLAVAVWATPLLVRFYGVTYSGARLALDLDLNVTVLGFATGISILTGLLFGLVPAWHASGADLVSSIKDCSPSTGSPRSRIRDALVIVQVALSMVLLAGAGLMIRSLHNIHRGPGFDPRPVVTLRLRPSLMEYDVAKAWRFQQDVVRRVSTIPGVVAVASARYVPLPGWGYAEALWLPGQEPADPVRAFKTLANRVGPDYFETLGVSVLEGRTFTDRDDERSAPVVVVNETVARHFWPRQSAVGRVLIVDGVSSLVIGVVPDMQYRATAERAVPFLYGSYWQQARTERFNGDAQLHVRVAGDPAAMLPVLRRAVATVDPLVPISEDLLLVDRLDFHFREVRAVNTMLITLGAVAMFLSAIALYTVLASAVRHRTRELAIRLALGARHTAVAGLVLRQGVALVGIGAGLGLLAALLATRALHSVLFGVGAVDVLTFTAVLGVLLVVAALACYLPASRAARIDPMEALRREQ